MSFSSKLIKHLNSFDLRVDHHYRIKTPEVVALFVWPSLLPATSKKNQIGVLNRDVLGPFYDQYENILVGLPREISLPNVLMKGINEVVRKDLSAVWIFNVWYAFEHRRFFSEHPVVWRWLDPGPRPKMKSFTKMRTFHRSVNNGIAKRMTSLKRFVHLIGLLISFVSPPPAVT